MTELDVLQQIQLSLNLFFGVIAGLLLGLIFWLMLKEN